MNVDSNPYSVNPLDQNDPRITKIGKFLRKSSFDEIPQLFNVLKGNMSIVGPRPEMPFIAEQYNELQRERLQVLPGITGLWQLSGDRKKAIHQPIPADILVVEGWVPDYDLAEIKGEFDRGRYKRILVTGFPLERGSFLSPYKTYADLAAATLVRMGVRADRVVAVPGREVRNNRTFASALALRDWLKVNDPSVRSVNVATKAVHARRSRLLFEKALGPGVAVGVIALPDYEYDPARWWRSSAGVKTVLREGIGYLYVRLVP